MSRPNWSLYVSMLLGTTACGASAGGPPEKNSSNSTDGGTGAGIAQTSSRTTATTGGSTSTGGSMVTGGTSAGGTTSVGGATSDGGAGALGGGGSDSGVPKNVLPCDRLTTVGEWEDITPPGVDFTQDFVIDPVNLGTVYLGGGQGFGIWKSTDCGSHWTKVNTGEKGDEIDGGGHWTLAIDHVNPDVLYTANGYGTNGVFKSTNAGVDWAQVLSTEAAAALQFGGFVERITLDPSNHEHILVSPHFNCENGHGHCLVESTDAGATWKILDNAPAVSEDSGQVMINSNLWFYASTWGDGLWRTSNAGKSWDNVHGGNPTDSFYIADDGTFWTTSLSEGVIKSTDQGVTWSVIPDSPHVRALVGDGTTLFVSNRNEGTPYKPYLSAPESDPTKWATLESPLLPRGGWVIHLDRQHNVLYSSTESNGFWRVKTK